MKIPLGELDENRKLEFGGITCTKVFDKQSHCSENELQGVCKPLTSVGGHILITLAKPVMGDEIQN